MTDEIREQISVFIDDELSAEECEFFVRRLQRDPASRSHYVNYQLIGAAIRGELDRAAPSDAGDLRRRVQLALGGLRPQPVRQIESRRSRFDWLTKPAVGVGVAASVAVAAVLGLRLSNGSLEIETQGAVADARADTTLELLSKPSYVVPLQTPAPSFATPPIQLTKYLMQHSEYASPLTRTTVHLNVVSGAANALGDAGGAAVQSPAPALPARPALDDLGDTPGALE